MESIRILQDTYEMLYAITPAVSELLEAEMPKISNWNTKCKSVLNKHTKGQIKNWSYFFELDLYYQLVLLQDLWDELENYSDSLFFSEKNKSLFISSNNNSVLHIRNEVAHPENWGYESIIVDDFNLWKNTLKKAANALNYDLDELIADLHEQEKEKLLSMILEKVINPALQCETLDSKTKESVKNTKERLEIQNRASGIIAFFEDALRSKGGMSIMEKLHENGLIAFEDIKDDIKKIYYG